MIEEEKKKFDVVDLKKNDSESSKSSSPRYEMKMSMPNVEDLHG